VGPNKDVGLLFVGFIVLVSFYFVFIYLIFYIKFLNNILFYFGFICHF